jgi:DNA repair exonuclease SbcCD ATPase subunit
MAKKKRSNAKKQAVGQVKGEPVDQVESPIEDSVDQDQKEQAGSNDATKNGQIKETGDDDPAAITEGEEDKDAVVGSGSAEGSDTIHETNEVDEVNVDNNEVQQLKERIEELQQEKDNIQAQYDGLLFRVSSMKSLFTNMKANELEIENLKEQLETYESQNLQLKQKIDSLIKENRDFQKTMDIYKEESESLNSECDRLSQELSSVRNELEEKESSYEYDKRELVQQLNTMKHKDESMKERDEELKVIIENEKLNNSVLINEVDELKEKIKELTDSMDSSNQEKDAYIKKNGELKQQLEALNQELKASQQQNEQSLEVLTQQIDTLKITNESLSVKALSFSEMEFKNKELEQELNTKQLQIGKLRHEAIILNEHLTKSLQLIRKSSQSTTVDRELITNLFISFVTIPRGDSKKYEVLQLISNFLGWNDEQKQTVGLIHGSTARKESFVSLWTDFLERESQT